MDSSLLRMLQSMKRIEDDPSRQFQTKTIDLATFVPKYPNVMIVDQSIHPSRLLRRDFPYIENIPPTIAATAAGPTQYEYLTNTLGSALVLPIGSGRGARARTQAAKMSKPGAVMRGWTIILKEGFYINPRQLVLCHSPDFSGIEIIGLNDVRILFNEPRGVAGFAIAGKVTLNNVRIYDFRSPGHGLQALKVGPVPASDLEEQAAVEAVLIDVKIYAPTIQGLETEEASVSLEGCAITGCREGIMSKGSQVKMNCSVISKNYLHGTTMHDGSKFTATRSRFLGPNAVWVQSDCDASIIGSDFEYIDDPNVTYAGVEITGVPTPTAVLVCHESILTCQDGCTFRGYDDVARVQGSDSKVSITGCKISCTLMVAHATENASLIVNDNVISSGLLIDCIANVKGRVEFLRNKLSANTRRIIALDRVSEKPKHDVHGVEFIHGPSESYEPSAKERSKHTKRVKKMAQEKGGGSVDYEAFSSPKFKRCDKCLKREDHDAVNSWFRGESAEPTQKFRYCKGCNELCYCSKECQLAHWPDHRLACRSKEAVAKDRAELDQVEADFKTKAVIDMVREMMGDWFIPSHHEEMLKFRQCGKCYRMEDEEEWKMRIPAMLGQGAAGKEPIFAGCGGCQSIFYCSKECQRLHWPDHRSACRGKKSSKK